MTHRALQSLDRCKALLIANTRWSDRVYRKRPRPLEEGELSAVFVMPGDDNPSATQNMAGIDSGQLIKVTAVRLASNEEELLDELYADRSEIHKSLMADIQIGLPNFVTEVSPAGAREPLFQGEGRRLIGAFETLWIVYYRMNFTDPN